MTRNPSFGGFAAPMAIASAALWPGCGAIATSVMAIPHGMSRPGP